MSEEVKNIEKVMVNGKRMFKINDTLYSSFREAFDSLVKKQSNSIAVSEDLYLQTESIDDVINEVKNRRILKAYDKY